MTDGKGSDRKEVEQKHWDESMEPHERGGLLPPPGKKKDVTEAKVLPEKKENTGFTGKIPDSMLTAYERWEIEESKRQLEAETVEFVVGRMSDEEKHQVGFRTLQELLEWAASQDKPVIIDKDCGNTDGTWCLTIYDEDTV